MRSRIGKIEIDFAANQVIDHNMLARRTKAERALIFKNVTVVLQLLEIALVNFRALALKIGAKFSADVRALVPV